METIEDIIRDILENDGWCISPTSLFDFDEDGGILLGDLAERIKVAHTRELAAKDTVIAELRECLQLAIQMKCVNCGLCTRGAEPCYPDGAVIGPAECWMIMKWREALEGGVT